MTKATLVILNAHVITLNQKLPTAEAVAIHERNILAVGSNKKIRRYIGKNTRVINAENNTVLPGLVDCHVHMAAFGRSLQSLDLRNATSIKETQEKLRAYANRNPEKKWILGGLWDHERFSEKRYPTRTDLDIAISEKPVFLTRVCGHAGVANTKALQSAGIAEETTVKGGKIDLDGRTGKPNGILRENALRLIWKTIPKSTQKEVEEACTLACQKAVEAGLTCVHWMIGSTDEMHAIQQLYIHGKLPLRVYLGIPIELVNELAHLGLETGFGNDMVKIGFVKILSDGSLGGHTAALREPYADKPDNHGLMLYNQNELDKLILKAHKAGLQLAVHAIGDLAIERVLDAYEKALKEHPSQGQRHRIEHCSVLNLALIERMKQLGLIASVQPHFVVSDSWVADRIGKSRARWVYPFRTLVQEGLIVASGSDCPVEPISPILGIWAAAARKSPPTEKLTIEDALKTYTLNAAYASFDEDKRGAVEAGKLADLTMVSGDLLGASPDDIRKSNVELTIVDGKVQFSR